MSGPGARIRPGMRVVYAGRMRGLVLAVLPEAYQARVQMDNGTLDWFRSDLMVPEGEHDPVEPTPGSWRDRAGFLWLEAGEPGSRRVFCYDAPVRRRMGDKWPSQPLEEAEASFGPFEPMVPGVPPGEGLETRYMLQFREGARWVDFWNAPVPLEAVEAMGGFEAVLARRTVPARVIAWHPGITASSA